MIFHNLIEDAVLQMKYGLKFSFRCLRIRHIGLEFHCKLWSRERKSNNTIISYTNNDCTCYGQVQYYLVSKNQSLIYGVIHQIIVLNDSVADIVPVPTNTDFLESYKLYNCGTFFKRVRQSENIVLVNVNNFVGKCIIIDGENDGLFLTEIINTFEHN